MNENPKNKLNAILHQFKTFFSLWNLTYATSWELTDSFLTIEREKTKMRIVSKIRYLYGLWSFRWETCSISRPWVCLACLMAYKHDKDKNKKLSYQGDVTVDLLRCQDREAGSTPLTKLNRLLCFVKKRKELKNGSCKYDKWCSKYFKNWFIVIVL